MISIRAPKYNLVAENYTTENRDKEDTSFVKEEARIMTGHNDLGRPSKRPLENPAQGEQSDRNKQRRTDTIRQLSEESRSRSSSPGGENLHSKSPSPEAIPDNDHRLNEVLTRYNSVREEHQELSNEHIQVMREFTHGSKKIEERLNAMEQFALEHPRDVASIEGHLEALSSEIAQQSERNTEMFQDMESKFQKSNERLESIKRDLQDPGLPNLDLSQEIKMNDDRISLNQTMMGQISTAKEKFSSIKDRMEQITEQQGNG